MVNIIFHGFQKNPVFSRKIEEQKQDESRVSSGGLNSNRLRNSENIVSASDLAEDVLIKCDYGEIRLFTIQSTVSFYQGSPDGRGGFLLVYQSGSGSKYGIVVLFSYAGTIWMKIKSTTWDEWKKIQLS